MQIKREIEVLRRGFTAPIDITYGTDLIEIALDIKDFKIPTDASVIVYAEKAGKQVKKIFAELVDNTIVFTPEKEFFEVGKNSLQIRVVHEEKSLFSFTIDVNCQKSHLNDDAEEVKEQPTLVELILAKLSRHAYNGIFTGVVKKENEKYILVSYVASEGTELVLDDLIIAADGYVYIVTKIGDTIELELTEVNLGTGGGVEVSADTITQALGYTPANPNTIPTKTSQLTNDSNFATLTSTGTAGQFAVSDGAGGITFKTIEQAEGVEW